MARVKRGVTAGRRHKKVLGKAKGYYNARRKVYRTAKQAVIKAGQYAYRDRRQKKREFRQLWIARINAAARLHDLSYNRFMAGLKRAGVEINRKVLADLAVRDPAAFGELAEEIAWLTVDPGQDEDETPDDLGDMLADDDPAGTALRAFAEACALPALA